MLGNTVLIYAEYFLFFIFFVICQYKRIAAQSSRNVFTQPASFKIYVKVAIFLQANQGDQLVIFTLFNKAEGIAAPLQFQGLTPRLLASWLR